MANPDKIERKWYVVDADGQTLGRLASEVAKVLRGKNKPVFTPHVDTGDYVIIVNADKVKVTGKKMEQKICQCCAMPIDESTFGTEADGSKNQDYCLYCYKNGHFTKNCTMDEMIEFNLKYLDEFNKDSEVKYTIDEARATMKEFFPQLKRWKK